MAASFKFVFRELTSARRERMAALWLSCPGGGDAA
jgi:hypothetical protein